jgi:hypothetical protein
LVGSSRVLQKVSDNIKTAIEQGQTDVIKSVHKACKIIFIVLLSLCIAVIILAIVQYSEHIHRIIFTTVYKGRLKLDNGELGGEVRFVSSHVTCLIQVFGRHFRV